MKGWQQFLREKSAFWRGFAEKWATVNGDHGLLVSYDQLLADPVETLAGICHFLDSEYPRDHSVVEEFMKQITFDPKQGPRAFQYFDEDELRFVEDELDDLITHLQLPRVTEASKTVVQGHSRPAAESAAETETKTLRIGLIHGWPGEKNSELELIDRCVSLLTAWGHECHLLSPVGLELDRHGDGLDEIRTPDDLDFCIAFHYSVPKFADAFTYFTNWNPTDYLLRDPITATPYDVDAMRYLNLCLGSYDCFLGAGSEELDRYAASLQAFGSRFAELPEVQFYPTSGTIEGIECPSLEDPKIFHVGINWERLLGVKRHGALLEKLDAAGIMAFYGVAELNGISMWNGFQCYRGELPFDAGRSLAEAANQCGISLVLSSDAHCRSAVVSTRIFQACAARTVIIADDHPFIVEAFGDAVLTFNRTGNGEDDCAKIQKLFDWIRENPAMALRKAARAHEIFVKRFTMERQLEKLVSFHSIAVERAVDRFEARSPDHLVDVVIPAEEATLAGKLDDVQRQQRVRTHVIIIASDVALAESSRRRLTESGLDGFVLTSSGDTLGERFMDVAKDVLQGEMVIFHSSPCSWQRNHLSVLVRAIEDGANSAFAGSIPVGVYAREHRRDYSPVFRQFLSQFSQPATEQVLRTFRVETYLPSAFLFRRDLLDAIGDKLQAIRLLDGGAFFYLTICDYIENGRLPVFVSKFTNRLLREPEQRYTIYHDSHTSRSQEISALQSVLGGTGFFHDDTPGTQNVGLLPLLQGMNAQVGEAVKDRPFLRFCHRVMTRIGVFGLRLARAILFESPKTGG